MNTVEDKFHDHYFIIDVIVRDDASRMQDVLKHSSIGDWGQAMKS